MAPKGLWTSVGKWVDKGRGWAGGGGKGEWGSEQGAARTPKHRVVLISVPGKALESKYFLMTNFGRRAGSYEPKLAARNAQPR